MSPIFSRFLGKEIRLRQIGGVVPSDRFSQNSESKVCSTRSAMDGTCQLFTTISCCCNVIDGANYYLTCVEVAPSLGLYLCSTRSAADSILTSSCSIGPANYLDCPGLGPTYPRAAGGAQVDPVHKPCPFFTEYAYGRGGALCFCFFSPSTADCYRGMELAFRALKHRPAHGKRAEQKCSRITMRRGARRPTLAAT